MSAGPAEGDRDRAEHLGRVGSVSVDETGVLLVRWEEGGVSALDAPPWLLRMDADDRDRWRQVEGGLQWGSPDRVVRLPRLKVDLEEVLAYLGLRALPGKREDRLRALGEFVEEQVTWMEDAAAEGADVDARLEALVVLAHRVLDGEDEP